MNKNSRINIEVANIIPTFTRQVDLLPNESMMYPMKNAPITFPTPKNTIAKEVK